MTKIDTYCCTTSHGSQKTRNRRTAWLILSTAQPGDRNDLLHRLTGNPVSGRSSGICADNLFRLSAVLDMGAFDGNVATYNSTLESEGECCCSVGKFDGAVGV
jgi:hypothetical protein